MQFEACLQQQLSLHTVFQVQDALKLCYQAAFGAEHLVEDVHRARRFFDAEYTAVPPTAGPLVEPLCPGFARVNLGPWKHQSLPPARLFELFLQTAGQPVVGGDARFAAYCAHVHKLAEEGTLCFSPLEWMVTLRAWRDGGGGPVRHSEAYRAAEKPAYRVVSIGLLERDFPLLSVST